METNRLDFSNSNMVRMREAIRYLTPEKLEIFIKIPFLLHINSPDYPGFMDTATSSHGIWNFKNSGFYREAVQKKLFPLSIIETMTIDNPSILGLYHIGSLGTFTQSAGSDFDFWVIINKRKFTKERYESLENKLNTILKYCREAYQQEVTFFVMDHKDVRNNCYALFDDQETLTAPKIFLKEEFYRTFLLIAGKIPVWCVMPDMKSNAGMDEDDIIAQVMSMHDDLIDLGQISAIPAMDILKGLLWHICKSDSDPVKALIKSTMIFSYGFSKTIRPDLLCNKIKQGYSKAGIDDFRVDPYKLVFDQILEFHEKEDARGINLIKNAIFFRICGYPDVNMPEQRTPKRELLEKYIRDWRLNQNQVEKLLSYPSWSESEKLLLEKTFTQRLAQMYHHAIRETGPGNMIPDNEDEKRNWLLLKNKTRIHLTGNPGRVPSCSTFLKRKPFTELTVIQKDHLWELHARLTPDPDGVLLLYSHSNFLGILGWILENQLYRRQTASMAMDAPFDLFESVNTPIDMDKLYMAFQPLKPLSDNIFEKEPSFEKMAVLLMYDPDRANATIRSAEFLVSNSWGELCFEEIRFSDHETRNNQCLRIGKLIAGYSYPDLRLFIYQYSDRHDPDIVYDIKKASEKMVSQKDPDRSRLPKKPYLDKL